MLLSCTSNFTQTNGHTHTNTHGTFGAESPLRQLPQSIDGASQSRQNTRKVSLRKTNMQEEFGVQLSKRWKYHLEREERFSIESSQKDEVHWWQKMPGGAFHLKPVNSTEFSSVPFGRHTKRKVKWLLFSHSMCAPTTSVCVCLVIEGRTKTDKTGRPRWS